MPPGREPFEGILHSSRDWAGFSRANDAEINFAQSDYFRCGTTNENLIGNIELIARDRLLDNFISSVFS
jgi:hypothetical protein